MEGSMEEGLRLAIRDIRYAKVEYLYEEDWASRITALEGAIGILVALREWQEAKLVYDNSANSTGIRLDMVEAARDRLKLAEIALLKL